MADRMARDIKANQDDLSRLNAQDWERKSQLARKLRALNKLSIAQSLLRAWQDQTFDRLLDRKTLERFARTEEIDKFSSDLVDDLEAEDIPRLVEMVQPTAEMLPGAGALAGLVSSALGSERGREMLGRLAPTFNQPAVRSAVKKYFSDKIKIEIKKFNEKGTDQGPLGIADLQRTAVSQLFEAISAVQRDQGAGDAIKTALGMVGDILKPPAPPDETAPPDKAMKGPQDVGGINMDSRLLNLQIKRDRDGVPLAMTEQTVANIKIEGLLPVIVGVTPIRDVDALLGLK